MKFKVGDLVRVLQEDGLFSKDIKGKLAVIKEVSSGDYGLHVQGFGDVWWYSQYQLELVAPSQRETFKQYCNRMFNSIGAK